MAVTTLHPMAAPPTPLPAASARTFYAVTVDTEEEWDWASGYPTGRPTAANVLRLPQFQDVCDRHGAAVTYFCNHAVLTDPDARAVVRELAGRPGVEVGAHIHPWNTPPVAPGGGVSPRDSFLHNLPWDAARAKLDALFDAFDRAGLAPTSFRGGRYSTSPRIQDYLRDRGVLVDASVLPFTTWADDGAPDYRGRDLRPVRLPPRRPGDAPLWELPLTFGYTRRPHRLWQQVFAAVDGSPLKGLRLIGLLGRLGVVRKGWLNLENPDYQADGGFLAAVRRHAPPFVCATLHSSSLLPGGNPYARTDADVSRVLATANRVLGELSAWPGFEPATVTQTAVLLEKARHARPRD